MLGTPLGTSCLCRVRDVGAAAAAADAAVGLGSHQGPQAGQDSPMQVMLGHLR